jgi:rubrerythrin
MELKGSATEQNLKDAFAGESQANRRYLYFASKADVEGYNDVAAVFRSTAEGETGHAHGHLEYLEEVGDPATGLPMPEKLTSTPTCTPVWRKPRVTKVSTRLRIGSKLWPKQSEAMPTASKRRWTTSTPEEAHTIGSTDKTGEQMLLPLFFLVSQSGIRRYRKPAAEIRHI